MPDILIELLSEEIPARMQARAAEDLKRLVTDGLVGAGLTYAHARAYATPRRLTLAIEGASAQSPTLVEDRKGPKVGAPQPAIDGFLRSTGLTLDQLVQQDDKKGAFYIARITKPGRPAAEILAEVLEGAIRNFPWPKSMRWGEGQLRWVRPLQSILCLMVTEAGAEVVPMSVDGIVAGNTTRGHRFMAPAEFPVSGFDDYAAKLRRAFVILDGAERAAMIENDAAQQAFALGLEVVPDAGLLAEVAGLVEWPVVLVGQIGEAFLDLPPEVLQTSMREHQKFFSLRNPRSGQIVRFVTVANRETADGGTTILAGNQKVLAARLSDAKFFWDNDLRVVGNVGLSGMAEGLAGVTFHNKLGSQKQRIDRICALAREIAPLVGADPELAAQAAAVAKADLQSAMVGEFPELQGVMGVYYARAQGLPDVVALACREHYQPLGPSDDVPTNPVSVAVALADKIDTLTGFWAIDEKPTGSKDPFALRRAALGVIRLVLGNGARALLSAIIQERISEKVFFGKAEIDHSPSSLALNPLDFAHALRDKQTGTVTDRFVLSGMSKKTGDRLAELVEDAVSDRAEVFKSIDDLLGVIGPMSMEERSTVEKFERRARLYHDGWSSLPDEAAGDLEEFCGPIVSDLLSFFHDRLKVYLRDQGIPHDVIDACLAMPGNDDLTLLVKRAQALSAFLKTDDGENLVQGFKRANNILTQAEQKDGVEYSYGPDIKFAESDAERALFAALDAAEAAITPAIQSEDFATAMTAMAALRAPLDAFFDAVQVNTDNEIIRRNRLNLLHRIRATCGQVADLTKLSG